MKREIIIREVPFGDTEPEEANASSPAPSEEEDAERQVIQTSVYYDMGGPNYFSGGQNKRGYYISVTPYRVTRHFRSTSAFSGTKALLEEAARFSQGKLEEVARSSKALEMEAVLHSHVAAKQAQAQAA
jgi:hypothetical protein